MHRPARRPSERCSPSGPRGPLVACALLSLSLLGPAAPAAETRGACRIPPGRVAASDRFTTSDACALCHDHSPRARALRDAKGRPVAPYDLWSGSPMASSSRDPIWRAAVSVEVALHPAKRAEIEAKCLRCHAPMGHVEAGARGVRPSLQALLGDRPADEVISGLARDGVSCTLCHQIAADGLGAEGSFDGGFDIPGDRVIGGPHEDPFARPMVRHTGFTPERARHITRAELCATCHTLHTFAIDSSGRSSTTRFPEQTPYLEWKSSAYSRSATAPGAGETPRTGRRTCQDCHLPIRDGDGQLILTAIAHNPGGRDFPPVRDRAPVGRHLLQGGNTWLPGLLARGAPADASPWRAELERAEARVRNGLRTRTADVRIESVAITEGSLELRVHVTNRCGHRFPTGHPSRRAWLRLIVTDAKGRTILRSGNVDERGRIVGSDDRPLRSEVASGPVEEPVWDVSDPGRVVRYEAVMEDLEGDVTWSLLSAARYRHDTRLLPAGWDADAARRDGIQPVGIAETRDFDGAGDSVRWRLALPESRHPPLRVEVDLLYQPVGARYAEEILRHDTPEVRRLRELWSARATVVETVASASVVVPAPAAVRSPRETPSRR